MGRPLSTWSPDELAWLEARLIALAAQHGARLPKGELKRIAEQLRKSSSSVRDRVNALRRAGAVPDVPHGPRPARSGLNVVR